TSATSLRSPQPIASLMARRNSGRSVALSLTVVTPPQRSTDAGGDGPIAVAEVGLVLPVEEQALHVPTPQGHGVGGGVHESASEVFAAPALDGVRPPVALPPLVVAVEDVGDAHEHVREGCPVASNALHVGPQRLVAGLPLVPLVDELHQLLLRLASLRDVPPRGVTPPVTLVLGLLCADLLAAVHEGVVGLIVDVLPCGAGCVVGVALVEGVRDGLCQRLVRVLPGGPLGDIVGVDAEGQTLAPAVACGEDVGGRLANLLACRADPRHSRVVGQHVTHPGLVGRPVLAGGLVGDVAHRFVPMSSCTRHGSSERQMHGSFPTVLCASPSSSTGCSGRRSRISVSRATISSWRAGSYLMSIWLHTSATARSSAASAAS